MSSDLSAALGDTFREPDKITSAVARHLLKTGTSTDLYAERGLQGIHPSEAARKDWCPRASYYRISGAEQQIVPTWFAKEIIYAIGHDIHSRWQRWFQEMRILRGMWECLNCDLVWHDTSPPYCPRCDCGSELIIYREVPLRDEEHLMIGSADADVLYPDDEWRLIEIKSIGDGTVRIDAPQLVKRHSYKHIDEEGKSHIGVDWYHLWRSISQPFPSHLRQGMLYCFLAQREEIVFIYEAKSLTAEPKEFRVKFRRSVIADVLDDCLKVRAALDSNHPPRRPMWAEIDSKICRQCTFHKTCWGEP